ncbi:hypothetical protein ABPG72_000685 [Tetrahymena utriculariae]
MIQIKNERKSSMFSIYLLDIQFKLKQCTLFHNKFGCYSFDLKYGNSSKRSPTINILKEKVSLDVIISFNDVPIDGEDIYISLYNQVLIKNKQKDVLISQQILKLTDYTTNKKESQIEQNLTFLSDGQLKAQIKYILSIKDPRVEETDGGPRNFMIFLRQWLGSIFLKEIISQVENEEKQQRLLKLKQQKEELMKKKREEEEENLKRQKEIVEEEKKRIEKQKRLEELNRLKQLKEEREQREKEKQKKEEEEKEKQKLTKQQQKEERLKQKRREMNQLQDKQKQINFFDEKELKSYEEESFEEETKNFKKQNESKNKQASNKRNSNSEEILEELIEEADDPNNNAYKTPYKSKSISTLRLSKYRQISYAESYYNIRGQSRENSIDKSFLNKSTSKSSSISKISKRNFMSLLKKWMCIFLRKIIKQTSKSDELKNCNTRFYIFGDEAFPYILIFDSLQQKLYTISPPKSLTMYSYSQAVSLPDGKIIICGGVNNKLNDILPICQLYDPVSNTSTPLSNMHQARYTHSAIYFNDYVYVIGGRTYGRGQQSILNSFERLNLKSNAWEELSNLQDGRCTSSLIGLQDKRWLYLIGGFSPKGRLNQIERFNIQDNAWQLLSIKLPLTVEGGFAFSVKGQKDQFYFMFGRSDEDRNEQIFQININAQNPEQNKIDIVGKVKKTRVLPICFVDENSKLYVFGGDENLWERFDIPSFESQFGKKVNQDLHPSDMKKYCSAYSHLNIA